MPGAVFELGRPQIRPGVYYRVVSRGGPPLGFPRTGYVAALFRADWGPLGVVTEMRSLQERQDRFGSGGTTDLIEQAMRGGAYVILGYRLGTGGVAASGTLQDNAGSPANVVTLPLKYVGTRGNGMTYAVQDSLANPALRNLVLYEGSIVLQTVPFAKGGGDEPQALVDAVNASDSPWFGTAIKIATGSGIMKSVASAGFAAAVGVDPTVVTADYSTALANISQEQFNVVAIDSESSTVHTTLKSWLGTQRDGGLFALAVIAEPTSVAIATRLADSAALNAHYMVHFSNGFKMADGTVIEGYKMAARAAGQIAGMPYTRSITHLVIPDAASVVGQLSRADIERAIEAGSVVLSSNSYRQVQYEQGLTTLVSSAALDAGFRKIRRVVERDTLMARIVVRLEPLIGQINNDDAGRVAIIGEMQRVIDQCIRDGALLPGGRAIVDPDNPPVGDQAWFRVMVDDVDSVEYIYSTFEFRFAPAA